MTPLASSLDPLALVTSLAARFVISLHVESEPSNGERRVREPGPVEFEPPIHIRAADIPPPNGFCVKVAFGWRSVEASFLPDTYAGNLIRAMGNATALARNEMVQLVETFAAAGNRLSVKVNDVPVKDCSALPAGPWHRFDLTALRMTHTVASGGHELMKEAEEAATACLALVLSLLPVEEQSDSPVALFEGGLPEGAKTRVETNRYERSPVNRAVCIAIYGAKCHVCDMVFGDKYGEIGAGFIEVHHRVPVSRMALGYIVNPRTDLIPLCSNCHSMVHRRDPPLDVEELKQRLSSINCSRPPL